MQKFRLIMETVENFGENYSVKKIKSPREGIEFMVKDLDMMKEPEEVFKLIALNPSLDIIGVFELTRGSNASASISVPTLLKRVIVSNATNFMVAHNHPSGNLAVSESDKQTTKDIKKASEAVGVTFVDHMIIASNGDFVSLRQNHPALFKTE